MFLSLIMCMVYSESDVFYRAVFVDNIRQPRMVWQAPNLTASCPANTNLTACGYLGFAYLNLLTELYSSDSLTTNNLLVPGENIYNYDKRGQAEDGCEGDEVYDFIIVGAGAGGCVMANRLTEITDWKILLIEAGHEQPDVTLAPAFAATVVGSSIDWQYKTEPNGKSCLAFGGRCSWPRGKVMGGTTAINTLTYARGHKLDYDNWAALGNDGWAYNEVLPYFKKSEKNLDEERLDYKYHDTHGPLYINRFPYTDPNMVMMVEAYTEAGVPRRDFNAEDQEAGMIAEAFTREGVRTSAYSSFIQPIRFARKNLKIKTNSEVYKILINENKKAYGVEYMKDGRIYQAFAKKEVIVSSGTVNSPKLLMLSGIGPRKHLEELNITVIQDLSVGENLQDHPTFHGIAITLPPENNTMFSDEQILQYARDYLKDERKLSPISSNGPANAVAFIKSHPADEAPSVQYQVNGIFWEDYVYDTVNYTATRILPTAFYNGITPRIQNVVPKSRGKLLLNSTDPYGKPLIYANYLDDPRDFEPLIAGTKFIISLENTKAFKERGAQFVKVPLKGCEEFEWGSDDYIVCLAKTYTSPTHHLVGTCKMGPEDDKTAVVDPRLRVYGIENLRTVDASVMPVVIRANTEAPTAMIAEKAADMVKEEWGRKNNKKCHY